MGLPLLVTSPDSALDGIFGESHGREWSRRQARQCELDVDMGMEGSMDSTSWVLFDHNLHQ